MKCASHINEGKVQFDADYPEGAIRVRALSM